MTIAELGPRYIYHTSSPLSTKRKIIRVIGYTFCTGLSLFVSEPSVKAALSLLPKSTAKKIFVGAESFISGLDWASFGTYGGCKLINSVIQYTTDEEKELFKPLFSKTGTGVVITASVILGLGQRLPTLPEAMKFNASHPTFAKAVAATSFFVESWLPSYTTFITINRVFNRRLFEEKLLIAKNSLIKWTANSKQVAIYMTDEERKQNLPNLLQNSPAPIELVFYDVWKNGKEDRTSSLSKRCIRITSNALGGIVLFSMIGLFLLDALLAKSAVNYFSYNYAWVVLGMALTVLPMIYGGPLIGWEGAKETVNMLTDQRQTYGEYVFPVIAKILKTIALLCSFSQYYEQKALVNTYLDPGIVNSLLTYTNTISCGFMIAKSYYTIVEAFLYLVAYYKKYDAEIYARIKERTDRMENLLLLSTPQQMLEILSDCTEDLKREAFNQGERTLLIQI